MEWIAGLGRSGLEALSRFGRAGIILGRTLMAPPDWRGGRHSWFCSCSESECIRW